MTKPVRIQHNPLVIKNYSPKPTLFNGHMDAFMATKNYSELYENYLRKLGINVSIDSRTDKVLVVLAPVLFCYPLPAEQIASALEKTILVSTIRPHV